MPRLPSIAALEKRSTSALIRTLRRFGIVVDAAELDARAALALKQVTAAEVPSAALVARAESALAAAGRVTVIRHIKDYVRTQQRAALGLKGPSGKKAVWIAVLDNRTCPDCLARHGLKKTMAEWEKLGLPGSDNLICDGDCRCDFLESSMVDGERKGDIKVSLDIEVTRD